MNTGRPLIECTVLFRYISIYERAIFVLADLIRGFCAEPENDYKVYENYSGRMMFGRKTIGIIVRQDQNYFEMMMKLTRYLESKDFGDPYLELEGVSIDELGLDVIVYFPAIRNYL